MLAAATSLFARTAISQNYLLAGAGQSPTPNGLPAPAATPPFQVGLWKVTPATHKVTGKRVSVWTCEKRSAEMERVSAGGRDRVFEVLKQEASSLSRLRHPCILEMVEPLEETRSELVFATEPLLSSLQLAIPPSNRSSLVELDEIEIQKGILQLCKGLAFMHNSAKLVHSNLSPQSIVINGAGDWKIAGLGLTVPLTGSDGSATRWEYLQYDSKLPAAVQRSFDYLAPEYQPDTPVSAASDMYSLGCLIYAVHCKCNPPFRNHGSLNTMRDNAGKPITGMETLDTDLRNLITTLLTKTANSRPSPSTLPTYPFFSSLPISTLNFLDRSNFASKTREEKAIFMKGLTGVLDRFSDGLKTRKILPSLLEEMKDPQLLPSILPNVFAISSALSATQFASLVLPSLKPLFAVKEPPQNMITLLDNLQLLQGKTEKAVFREHVLPLVYNALESDHAVQERALLVVPDLCETIDYAEVQGVLFPRVALVFTKTKLLSVKVSSLVCFRSMVKTLDQTSLTQKLVPLLSRIRTKEPSVMLATLDVQEAMGLKVDREAVATLVLPQLWTMSIGPLLNLDQFNRFMRVIRMLGDRVEKEHGQHLRDTQRVDDHSATQTNGAATHAVFTGSVNFETLVGGSAKNSPSAGASTSTNGSWDDDVWGTILGDTSDSKSSRPTSPTLSSRAQTRSMPASPMPFSAPFNPPLPSTAHNTPVPSRLAAPPRTPSQAIRPSTLSSIPPPSFVQSTPRASPATVPSISAGLVSLIPQGVAQSAPHARAQSSSQAPPPQSKPNYNISLSPASPLGQSSLTPTAHSLVPSPSAPLTFTPLAPTVTGWSTSGQGSQTKQDWGDFDPLK